MGKTLDELKEVVVSLGMPAFTAKQIADWLYKKRVTGWDAMTNLSLSNRTKLAEHYELGCSQPVDARLSADGTVKYLFATEGGKTIESVFIPEPDRATLCVSSQIGCKMNCLFCMTGKQGFSGNLSVNEILNQIQSVEESERLTNVVFMGMGEPMDNIQPVLKALEILTADYGYGWSPKRITVSTIGHVPGLKRFLEESNCHLAISIHSPFHEERLSLMPVEKAFPMEAVVDLLKEYDFSHQRRLSFEYILFEGLNDDIRHATALVKQLRGLDCRVNLIAYHAIPGVDLSSSNEQNMKAFQEYLNKKGITCTIRKSRGMDIFAACGMLSSKSEQ